MNEIIKKDVPMSNTDLKDSFNQVLTFLREENVMTNDIRHLLGTSLFYYCCGHDPTPILIFQAQFPLYVYVDIVDYGVGDFNKETHHLYNLIEQRCNDGSKLTQIRKECLGDKKTCFRLSRAKNVELTEWKCQNTTILLLYVQQDAEEGFIHLYSDNENYIQPRCVCNYRYELNHRGILSTIEKRCDMVFGHCNDERKYKCIGEFPYMADYCKKEKISLFQRQYWYVF